MGEQSRHRMPTAQVGFEGYRAQIKPEGEANSVQNCSLGTGVTVDWMHSICTKHPASLWIDQMNLLADKADHGVVGVVAGIASRPRN
jgi:hypothetical protein